MGKKLCYRRTLETNAAKNFFTKDVVGKWNILPRKVVNSSSIDSFKRNLDKHFNNVPNRYAIV